MFRKKTCFIVFEISDELGHFLKYYCLYLSPSAIFCILFVLHQTSHFDQIPNSTENILNTKLPCVLDAGPDKEFKGP